MVQASCLSLTLAEGWGIHTFLLPTYNSMSIFNNNNCKLLLGTYVRFLDKLLKMTTPVFVM